MSQPAVPPRPGPPPSYGPGPYPPQPQYPNQPPPQQFHQPPQQFHQPHRSSSISRSPARKPARTSPPPGRRASNSAMDYEEHIAAGLAQRVEELAAFRAGELRYQAEAARREETGEQSGRGKQFALGIVSLSLGVPITAITATGMESGNLIGDGHRVGRHRRGQCRARAEHTASAGPDRPPGTYRPQQRSAWVAAAPRADRLIAPFDSRAQRALAKPRVRAAAERQHTRGQY